MRLLLAKRPKRGSKSGPKTGRPPIFSGTLRNFEFAKSPFWDPFLAVLRGVIASGRVKSGPTPVLVFCPMVSIIWVQKSCVFPSFRIKNVLPRGVPNRFITSFGINLESFIPSDFKILVWGAPRGSAAICEPPNCSPAGFSVKGFVSLDSRILFAPLSGWFRPS